MHKIDVNEKYINLRTRKRGMFTDMDNILRIKMCLFSMSVIKENIKYTYLNKAVNGIVPCKNLSSTFIHITVVEITVGVNRLFVE